MTFLPIVFTTIRGNQKQRNSETLQAVLGLGGETWSHMDGSTWRLKRANFGSCFDMQCKTVSHFLLEAVMFVFLGGFGVPAAWNKKGGMGVGRFSSMSR